MRSNPSLGELSSRGESALRAEGANTKMRLRVQQSQTSASRNLHARGGCTEIVEPSPASRPSTNLGVAKLAASASLRNLVNAGLRHLAREDAVHGASTSRRPPQDPAKAIKSGLAKPYATQIHTSLQKRPPSRNQPLTSSQGLLHAGSRINGPIAAAKTQFRINSHKLDMLATNPDQPIPAHPTSQFNQTYACRPPKNKNLGGVPIMKNKSSITT